MILRIMTESNYLDIELKERIKEEQLMQALDNMNTLMLSTKNDTVIFINPVNIIALEIIDIPPIQKEK